MLASVQSVVNEVVIEHPLLHFWLYTLSAFARSDMVALGIVTGMWYTEWAEMKRWRRMTEYQSVWVAHAIQHYRFNGKIRIKKRDCFG